MQLKRIWFIATKFLSIQSCAYCSAIFEYIRTIAIRYSGINRLPTLYFDERINYGDNLLIIESFKCDLVVI